MDAIKRHYEKVGLSDDKYKCNIEKKKEDGTTACNAIVVVGKDLTWNLKRHIMRQHADVWKVIESSAQGFSLCLDFTLRNI